MLPFDEFGVSSSGFVWNKTEKLAHFICISRSFTSQQGQEDFFRASKTKTRGQNRANYIHYHCCWKIVLPFLCNAISM